MRTWATSFTQPDQTVVCICWRAAGSQPTSGSVACEMSRVALSARDVSSSLSSPPKMGPYWGGCDRPLLQMWRGVAWRGVAWRGGHGVAGVCVVAVVAGPILPNAAIGHGLLPCATVQYSPEAWAAICAVSYSIVL